MLILISGMTTRYTCLKRETVSEGMCLRIEMDQKQRTLAFRYPYYINYHIFNIKRNTGSVLLAFIVAILHKRNFVKKK